MGIGSKQLFVRIGSQASRTAASASMVNVAVPADGNQLAPTLAIENLDTDHGSPGVLYSDIVGRNEAAQQFRTYLYPDMIGRVMNNLLVRTSGEQGFLTIESWWPVDALGTNKNRGERFKGVVMDSLSLDISKVGIGAALVAEFQAFVNEVETIPYTEALPSLTFNADGAYKSNGVLIDFVPNVATGAFGGHNADVRRVGFRYSNAGTVDGFESDLTAATQDTIWTIHTPGEQSVEVEVTVSLTLEEYTTLQNATALPSGALRLVLTHPASDSTTTTDAVVGNDDTTQTLGVADSTHFAVGDYVLLKHPSGDFAVGKVEAVRSGPDEIDIAGIEPRVDVDGGTGGPVTVRNMTGVLNVDSMKFQSKGPAVRDGNKRVVTLRYLGALAAGATAVLEGGFYDHASGHA